VERKNPSTKPNFGKGNSISDTTDSPDSGAAFETDKVLAMLDIALKIGNMPLRGKA
jgi:hypothetical protein